MSQGTLQHLNPEPAAAQTADAAPPLADARESRVRPSGGGGDKDQRAVSYYDRCKFELVRWFLWLWTRLFSLRGLYLLGQFFGTIEYALDFRRRARYRNELGRIFGGKLSASRQKKIIRKYFRRTRCDKLFYLVFDRLPREKILKRIKFHGKETLDAALARGRGVYVMISHNGSHHVAGLLMALMGYRCAGVRDRNEGPLRRYMQDIYNRTFPEFAAIRVLYADSFPRDIYRCFQDNFTLASALDVSRVRGLNLKTCKVQMFGEEREFLTGTLQVALRSRAAICQGFVVSRKNFYFRLILNEPLHVPPDNAEVVETPELVAELMQCYADGIAAHVRKYPDHLSRI